MTTTNNNAPTMKHKNSNNEKNKCREYFRGAWRKTLSAASWPFVDSQRFIAACTLILAFGTVALAIVSCEQIQIMKADQRPWIGIDATNYPPGSQYALQFRNTGKSPALNVSIVAFAWDPQFGDKAAPIPKSRYVQNCKITNMDMFPNMFVGFKLRADSNDLSAWMIARVDYDDADGGHHETGVCFVHFSGSNSISDCPIPNSNYAK